MTVHSIEEGKPHLTLRTADGNAHVLPVALIKDIISGAYHIENMDDWNLIVRRIMEEWLNWMEGE